MKDDFLLNDKFAPAKLPETCAPRHALLNLFHREASKRVIYVSAPAGYGKTVSTLLWLKNSGRVPLWIGLDEYDNSPSIFYKLFCTGILSLQPGNKAMADILASPAFASSPVEHTIRLLSEFMPDDNQYVVVLDDMHLVTNEEIRKSGLLVQKRLPSSFLVVILTRNEVEEKYTSVTGEKKCTVITAHDLAFSRGEIQKYFGEYGRFITAEESEAVYAVTNGWAIGVNALAMSGQMELGQNSGQVLGNYIKTQIWNKWDDDLKDFMLKTSVADEMTPELVEKLTGVPDSRGTLEKLYSANSFISRLNKNTYRYHHLFLDFLRNILHAEKNLDTGPLYKAAGEYYFENGEPFTAVRYAVKSKDSDIMMKMLYEFVQYKAASVGEYVDFSKNYYEDAIPESICDQHPYIYASLAYFQFLCGNAPKMEYYMDKIYRFLPKIAIKFPDFLEMTILVVSLDHRTSFSKQLKQFAFLPPIKKLQESQQGPSISLHLPYMYRSNRDYHELMDEKVVKKLPSTFGRLLREKLGMVMEGLRAGFLYERNKLKESLDYALKAHSMMYEVANDELAFCALIQLASIYFAMGYENLFGDILEQTDHYIETSGAHFLRPNFLAYKTKIRLLNGNKATAGEWLDNYFVTESKNLELYKIFQHFTTVRAYIALSQTDKAMNYILKLKQLATDFRRPLDIAEAGVLQAALEWATGNKKEAVESLETVLTAMQKYGFVRVIADEGAAVLPILKKLTLNLKKDSYQGSLDAHFLNEVMIAAYEQSKRRKGVSVNIRAQKPIKLSKQQKYIITLLAKGYKNAEIVDITGLTIHTVKSHETAAYAKLDVNNAMDAVIKARELRLIE